MSDYQENEGVKVSEKSVSSLAQGQRSMYLEVLGAGLVLAAVIGASETVLANSGPSPFGNENGAKNQVIVPPEHPPVYEISKIYPQNLELLYPGLDVYRQVSALDISVTAAEKFALNGGDIKRLKDLFPKVEHYAEKYGIPKWVMLGQIAAESKGNADAVSPAGAEGVAQIMFWLSSERGIDPYDVDESLDAMGQIIREEYDRFGDWSLAVWSWHVGDGEVYWAVQAFERATFTDPKLRNVYVPLLSDPSGLSEANTEGQRRRDEYKQFITANKVNTYKLFEVEEIKGRYSEPGFNLTLDYLNRIAGLSIKLEDLIEGRVEIAQ